MTTPFHLLGVAAGCLVLATGAQAQVISRDDGSSSQRAPTAAESAALARSKAIAPRIGMITGKVNPQPVVHSDGTVEQELDASTMAYTVARRNPDGSISMVCVTGEEQATKALKSPIVRNKSIATGEHKHEVK